MRFLYVMMVVILVHAAVCDQSVSNLERKDTVAELQCPLILNFTTVREKTEMCELTCATSTCRSSHSCLFFLFNKISGSCTAVSLSDAPVPLSSNTWNLMQVSAAQDVQLWTVSDFSQKVAAVIEQSTNMTVIKNNNISVFYNFKTWQMPCNVAKFTKHQLENSMGVNFNSEGAQFNGNKYVNVTNTNSALSALFKYNIAWSVFVKFKVSNVGSITPIILTSTSNGLVSSLLIQIVIQKMWARLRDYDNSWTVYEVSSNVMPMVAGQWHTVAFSFNGNSFTFYFDGVIQTGRSTNSNMAQTFSAANNEYARIGFTGGGIPYYFPGVMSCFGVSESALSQSQFSAVFDSLCG